MRSADYSCGGQACLDGWDARDLPTRSDLHAEKHCFTLGASRVAFLCKSNPASTSEKNVLAEDNAWSPEN